MNTLRIRMAGPAIALLLLLGAVPAASAQQADPISSPAEFLGHEVGADFKLASWKQIVGYFKQLGEASDRIHTREIGRSTEDRPFLLVEISSAANLRDRKRLIAASRRIADPRRIPEGADQQALGEARTVIGLACSMHATEVGASQMSMELAWRLATGRDPETQKILDHCVILLFPSHNPDGLDMVRDWYLNSLGTPWEGGRMPWIYQKYAGHDNNRDWFMLNLKETRLVTRILYREWAPTIYCDIHQMGNLGARFFVPPYFDPINPNLDPVINQGLQLIGGHMSAELFAAGKRGVVTGAIYDNWWAGYNTIVPQHHNIFAVLTEAASVNRASPIFQRKGQLTGARRGIPRYDEPTVKFPDPWPGGWWRLRDIVDYELIACRSLFVLGAKYRNWFLAQQLAMGRQQIALGQRGAPFAWLVPLRQRDPGRAHQMLAALHATAIEIHQARAPFTADGVKYPAGTRILYAAQPFRLHLKDMMERQWYPKREAYPGGPPEAPYDMAGWNFPLQMGVSSVPVVTPFKADARLLNRLKAPAAEIAGETRGAWWLVRNERNDDFALLNRLHRRGTPVFVATSAFKHQGRPWPPGTLLFAGLNRADLEKLLTGKAVHVVGSRKRPDVAVQRLHPVRLGLYQPWAASMDEGWMRLVLERHDFPYITLHNADFHAGAQALRRRVDAILLPSASRLLNGVAKDAIPPQYAGGLGEAGVAALQQFTEAGGTVVASDHACNLLIDHFNLPVKNLVKGKKKEEFYCPGSLLRIVADPSHPLAFGFPKRGAGFFTKSQAFEIEKDALPTPKKKKTGAAIPGVRQTEPAKRYATTAPVHYAETLLLLSGYLHHPEVIAGKPAIVDIAYGRGRVVLLGFHTQHRAQAHGTFRLLFNALVRPGMKKADLPS